MSRYLLLLLIVALASPIHLIAADDARVDGKMIVNGKTIKFTHAYAIARTTGPGEEKSYRVIFSDVAISDKDLALFPDVLIKAINDGTLHAMRFRLDSHGAVDSTDIDDASGGTTIKEESKIELKTFNGKTIAGRIHLEKPYNDGIGKYDYDLKFSAPVRQEADLNPQ